MCVHPVLHVHLCTCNKSVAFSLKRLLREKNGCAQHNTLFFPKRIKANALTVPPSLFYGLSLERLTTTVSKRRPLRKMCDCMPKDYAMSTEAFKKGSI